MSTANNVPDDVIEYVAEELRSEWPYLFNDGFGRVVAEEVIRLAGIARTDERRRIPTSVSSLLAAAVLAIALGVVGFALAWLLFDTTRPSCDVPAPAPLPTSRPGPPIVVAVAPR